MVYYCVHILYYLLFQEISLNSQNIKLQYLARQSHVMGFTIFVICTAETGLPLNNEDQGTCCGMLQM